MDAETITLAATGAAGGLAVVGAVFQKLGLVRFGREKENGAGKCPDADCHSGVVKLGASVEFIVASLNRTERGIEKLSDSVSKAFDKMDKLNERLAHQEGINRSDPYDDALSGRR